MHISGAESRIMDALWRRGPLLVDEVLAEVTGPQNWTDATAKALIGRLLKKKAIRAERVGGSRVRYHPLFARDDYMLSESRGFLERMFGGELAPFVTHFAKHQPLSPEDRAKLKALIATLDDEEGSAP